MDRGVSTSLRAAGPSTAIARRFGTIERAIILAEGIALTYLDSVAGLTCD
jgi:hypothetical protein